MRCFCLLVAIIAVVATLACAAEPSGMRLREGDSGGDGRRRNLSAFAPSPSNFSLGRMAVSGLRSAVMRGNPARLLSKFSGLFGQGRTSGYQHLRTPLKSHSIGTPLEEREKLGLRGLLPAGIVPLSAQLDNLMEQLRDKSSDIERYNYLATIQDGHEDLFFAALVNHTFECMPFVYTPTVGEACMKWHKIYRHSPRGLYISLGDLGNVRKVLKAWPEKDIKAICLTDGERILGLGDLGANGMGIPVGKLALYTACAGISPAQCLPVHIDTGTNNLELRNDPAYMGLRQERERGPSYDALIKEFVEACQAEYGRSVLLQFEDFGNQNAFRLMGEYQSKACTFNDDIQGTASVVVAGLIASVRITGVSLAQHKFLFYGAGEAGVGIADLLAEAISKETGVEVGEARKNIWLMDSKGLVCDSRQDKLAEHKLHYAHHRAEGGCTSLLECVEQLKPTALLGVSAVGGSFTEDVVKKTAQINDRPLVFALSNPTSKAECTAEQAYTWTNGKCIFASGSPMSGATINGQELVPGQGNNAYIFPGVGLAAIAAGAKEIDDTVFLIAAKSLADQVSEERLSKGTLYPPLAEIRDVSAKIAADVAEYMYDQGVATVQPRPANLLAHCKSIMYDPTKAKG